MQIILNGAPAEISDSSTARQLVEQLALGGKRIALEVNGEIVPRSQHAKHKLQPGDQVEIIHAIGGG